MYVINEIIRSTPPSQESSRPNNIRGGNVRPSVDTSVHPQKVCPISMKFGVYIEVDE